MKKNTRTPSEPVPEPVSEPVPSTEETTVLEEGEESKEKKVLNKESIIKSFDDIINSIESEIESLREGDNKNKGIKFLRTITKRLKVLKNNSSKIIKQKKNNVKKSTNNNSGFLKPVKISKEMAKFTGWNVDEPKSRVDVTKFLCQYIRDNELQNPKDRRQIIADTKLSKLLKYDAKKENEPLTYYKVQTCLKPHFLKSETVVA
jgi:upstream activation factor subunit UAF30